MTSSPPVKKNLEASYLHLFRSLTDVFPAGRIEPTERPDFLIHRGDASVLGIDVTTMHVSPSPGAVPIQAAQAMRKSIVDRARALYSEASLPAVHVSVFFDDRPSIGKSDVETIAAAICRVVASNLPNDGDRIEVRNWDDRSLPDPIQEIAVTRLANMTKPFFANPDSVWVAPLLIQDVKRTLESKEELYAAYRKRCQEAWLLICADTAEHMSTWFEFEKEPLAHRYKSSFDRAFLLQQFGQQVHELNVWR